MLHLHNTLPLQENTVAVTLQWTDSNHWKQLLQHKKNHLHPCRQNQLSTSESDCETDVAIHPSLIGTM